VDRIYLTRVHQSPEGDAFFPPLNEAWQEVEKEEKNGFSFVKLERIEN
jgi:dihydrofolate reductase